MGCKIIIAPCSMRFCAEYAAIGLKKYNQEKYIQNYFTAKKKIISSMSHELVLYSLWLIFI